MSTRIGCDHFVYAKMTTEDTATTAPVYADPVNAPGVISININPNAASETLFADDGPYDVATTLGKDQVEINKAALKTSEKADLLGHTIAANGGILYGDSDVPPWAAIGFRTLKSNGMYRFVWLYKGKFTDPEDNNETKGDSINFQTDTIKGQFVKLNNETVVDKAGTKRRIWKYELDADYEDADATTIASWFTKVAMPTPATS